MMSSTANTISSAIALRRRTLGTAKFSLMMNFSVLVMTSWGTYQTRMITNDVMMNIDPNDELSLLYTRISTALLSTMALLVLVSIVAILMDVLLLYGVLCHRPGLLQCWLCGHAITSGVYFLQFWEASMTYFTANDLGAGLVIMILILPSLVLTVCLWTVVHSYEQKLRQVETEVKTCTVIVTGGLSPASD